MLPSRFQVIAEARGRDSAALEGIQRALGRAFGLDLALFRSQLLHGGVTVARVSSLEEAQRKAQQVQEAGADFRIQDAQGQVLLEGRASARPGAAPAPRTAGPGGAEASLAATKRGWSPDPGPSVSSATPFSSAPDLDELTADALVLLDGSTEEPFDEAPVLIVDDPSSRDFLPPEEEGEEAALDLAMPMPAPAPAPTLPEPEQPTTEYRIETVDQPYQAAPSPTSPPGAERVMAPGCASGGMAAARRGAALAPALPSGPLLMGGKLREHPRLRVLVGFLLALGLGAILPTCYARSVYSSRLTPQLEDLSTVLAHGPRLRHLSNYRSAEQIQQAIASIQTRSGFTTVLIWLAIAGLLGFLWFRFS